VSPKSEQGLEIAQEFKESIMNMKVKNGMSDKLNNGIILGIFDF
jgi:hypothetical protein